MDTKSPRELSLFAENAALRARLEESEDLLRAIRNCEVDALVVESTAGPRVFTLPGEDAEANRFRGEMLAQVRDAVVAVDDESRVTYLNAAAERLYGVTASEALGHKQPKIYEALWATPEEKVTATAALHEHGEWRGENIHIRPDGRITNVESSITVLRDRSGQRAGMLAVIRDVSERKRHEDKLLISEVRYRRLFEAAHDGVLILDPATGKIIDANPFMTQMLGYPRNQLVGKQLFEIGMFNDAAASEDMLRELKQAAQVRYDDLPLVSADGRHQDVEVIANLYDESGRSVIQFNIRDISERKRSEAQVTVLMAEVNHRAKNLLTVVQAIARQTAHSGDPLTYAQRLCERVDGLAAGQDLLVKTQWQGVDLAELINGQLAHFRDLIGTRITIEGPPLQLTTPAAQGIGMAVHELTTNAAKYGALSNLDGRVSVAWHVKAAPEPMVLMSWREDGGPKVTTPARKGFGSVVIGRLMEAAVDGIVEVAFRESGMRWNLSAPVANTLASTQGGRGDGRQRNITP